MKLMAKPVTAEGADLPADAVGRPQAYLPLRDQSTVVTASATGTRPRMTDDFRWQSPTKTNLARLHAAEERGTIPASFRSLPSTYAPVARLRRPVQVTLSKSPRQYP